MGFLFAPRFHPAMRHVMPARRDLGIPTIFNYLGPLANPAGALRQLLGVSGAHMGGLLAEVLAELGCERALVVHGSDGLDEATLCGTTTVHRVEDGQLSTFELNPWDLGLEPVAQDELRGAGPERNAAITLEVLEGVPGPKREVACLNAGLALVAGGIAKSVVEGLEMSRRSIDSGAALGRLEALRLFTREAPA
jgi:anthranilate phosphoribosyltransferase